MSELLTVAQLIEALKAFPADTPVVVNGYESGYENMMPPKIMKLQHQNENKYWGGEFQEVDQERHNTLNAVVLNRKVRSDDA